MATLKKDYFWWRKNDSIGIGYISDNALTAPSEAVEIKVFYGKALQELRYDELQGSPQLPEQFHEALVYKAIQTGYERKPEAIQIAAYWKLQFENLLSRIQEFKNTSRTFATKLVRTSKAFGVK